MLYLFVTTIWPYLVRYVAVSYRLYRKDSRGQTRAEALGLRKRELVVVDYFDHCQIIWMVFLRLLVVAHILRLCDALISAKAVLWGVGAAMVAEQVYRTVGRKDRPASSRWTLVVKMLVSLVLGIMFDSFSTLIGCWVWVQSLYVAFADHLPTHNSDHEQVTVFLAGVSLSSCFSILLLLLNQCDSICGAVAIDVGIFTAAAALAGALVSGYRWRPFIRLQQLVLYAAKLLLIWSNATVRYIVKSRQKSPPQVTATVRETTEAPPPDSAYQYSPLTREEIRLLRLLPGRGSDPIRCKIHVVPLESAPAYEAMSYRWMSNELTHSVLVCGNGQGKHLVVTASAHAALTKLRSRWCQRELWIDGLCIDQTNKDEKESQVRLMGKVFARAWRVEAYLGASETGATVQAHLARLRYLKLCREMSFEQIRDATYGSDGWTALSDFFRKSWFQRVWIIQEAALSQELHLHYGDVCIDWELILQVINTLIHPVIKPLYNVNGSYTGPGKGDIFRGLEGVCAMIDLQGLLETSSDLTLGTALKCALRFDCGDKRDKIYGLLSLIGEPGVEPDYHADYRTVYRETMSKILRQDATLEALCFAGHGKREPVPGLPSWVSDWDHDSRTGLYKQTYTAKAGQAAAVVFDAFRPLSISIEGWKRDTVKLLGEILKHSENASESDINRVRREWHESARDMAKKHGTNYPETERLEVYIRTVLGDRLPDVDARPPTPDECMELYNSVTHVFSHFDAAGRESKMLDRYYRLRELVRQAQLSQGLLEPEESREAPLEIQAMEERLKRVFDSANNASRFQVASSHLPQNRFCITKEGRTAVVPPKTQEGDIVCVFKGASMPFLLRPQGAAFELIGCCYVHGLMELGWVEDKPETFRLV